MHVHVSCVVACWHVHDMSLQPFLKGSKDLLGLVFVGLMGANQTSGSSGTPVDEGVRPGCTKKLTC